MKRNFVPLLSFFIADDVDFCQFPGNYSNQRIGIYNTYEPLATSDSESPDELPENTISKAEFKKIIKRLKRLAKTKRTMHTSKGRAYRVTKVSASKKGKPKDNSKSKKQQADISSEILRIAAEDSKTKKTLPPSVFQEILSWNISDKPLNKLKTADDSSAENT